MTSPLNPSWLAIPIAAGSIFLGFQIWWGKKLSKAKTTFIENTHGAKILLVWPLRLFNLITCSFQSLTGKYILKFHASSFLPESYYPEELKVLLSLGPELPCSTEEFRVAQKDGIRLLCEALNSWNFPWSGFGRLAQWITHKREFRNRQAIVKFAQEHPEILETPVDANNGLLIITGLPRTGSTFLQSLLSLDPNGKTPFTWEMWHSVPPSHSDSDTSHPNIAKMKKNINAVDISCPNFMETLRRVHFFDAQSPEEDTIFLYHAPWRWNFLCYVWGSELADWWLNSPMSAIFACRYLHLCFKVMTTNLKPKLVITKNPGHSYFLPQLLKEFPNANIVVTHRHPKVVVPSWSKLCLYSWHLFTQNEFRDEDRVAGALSLQGHKASILKQLTILAKRLVDTRRKLKETQPEQEKKQFFDVEFGSLISDPVGMVKRIYNHFGYEFSDEFEKRIIEYTEHNPARKKYSRVSYSLAELDLTEEDINLEFSDYIETYQQFF